MILRATADTVRLDMDEHGWTLAIDTSDGDSLVVNIQDAAYELAGSAGLRALLEWRAAGETVEQIAGQVTVDDMLAERYGLGSECENG